MKRAGGRLVSALATVAVAAIGWWLWTWSFKAVDQLSAWSFAPLVQLAFVFGGLTVLDFAMSHADVLIRRSEAPVTASLDAREGGST